MRKPLPPMPRFHMLAACITMNQWPRLGGWKLSLRYDSELQTPRTWCLIWLGSQVDNWWESCGVNINLVSITNAWSPSLELYFFKKEIREAWCMRCSWWRCTTQESRNVVITSMYAEPLDPTPPMRPRWPYATYSAFPVKKFITCHSYSQVAPASLTYSFSSPVCVTSKRMSFSRRLLCLQ